MNTVKIKGVSGDIDCVMLNTALMSFESHHGKHPFSVIMSGDCVDITGEECFAIFPFAYRLMALLPITASIIWKI